MFHLLCKHILRRVRLYLITQSFGFVWIQVIIIFGFINSPPMAYGDTHVLSIGVAKYNDPAIPGTLYADTDAKAFGGLWSMKGFGPAKESNIHILINEYATRSNIEKIIKTKLSNSSPEDRVYIFFAGHGDTMKMPNGKTVTALLPYDTELGDITTCYVLNNFLGDIERHIPAKQGLLVMDCCHSGAAGSIRGLNIVPGITASGKSKDVERFLDEQSLRSGFGWGVFTACRPEEKSRSTDKYRHGFFTFWLKHGLLGLADQKLTGHVGNNDGEVTFGELQQFVYNRVVQFTKGTQHPVSSGLFHPETKISIVEGAIPVVPGLDEFLSVFALQVKPVDAEILCDGKVIHPINASRGVEILPGRHTVLIKREGFHSISFIMELREGERYERRVRLKRKARPGFMSF